MRSGSLRHILLALSLERADRDGFVVPPEERLAVTREAARTLASTSGAAEQLRFFAERAALLLERIASRHPALDSIAEPSRRAWLAAPVVLAAAAIAGWFTQALGAEKLINILSFPLLGILAWNLAIYVIEAISVATGLRRRSDPVASENEQGWIEKLGAWSADRRLPADLPPALHQGWSDFQKRWRVLHGPVVEARLRALLHLGAAVLAGAALAGMYAKGIANEYRAYWESTFLTPESLRRILGTLLGPASAVSGIAIPDAESLAALRRTAGNAAGSENAAKWIHLHAVTVALFVIGPRLLLAGWKTFQAARWDRAADPRTTPGAGMYFDRLLADALGTALPVSAVAYCHGITPTGEAALRRHVEHTSGAPVRLVWLDPVSLGGEDAFFLWLKENKSAAMAHLVLVMDLAATPEVETHGDFLRRLRDTLADCAPEVKVQICLDPERFNAVRRHLPDYDARLQDRLAAWKGVAGPLREELGVCG